MVGFDGAHSLGGAELAAPDKLVCWLFARLTVVKSLEHYVLSMEANSSLVRLQPEETFGFSDDVYISMDREYEINTSPYLVGISNTSSSPVIIDVCFRIQVFYGHGFAVGRDYPSHFFCT